MKQILIPFGADSDRDVPIEAASQLAHRHNGQITGIFYPRLPDPVIVDPMSGGVVSYDGLDEEIEAQKNSAGDLIRQRAAACNPRIGDKQLIVDMTSLSNWRQVGEICRVYDVSIIGRSNENPHWQTLFEMALFEGGRPVLVVPPSWGGKFGETVGIAWNHSTETARVLALSMPIIRMAKKVIVIEVDGWVHAGPDGKALQRYLEANEVEVEIKKGAPSGNAGERVLEIASSCGVDFLVKGAFTQSRLTQMIFGGATRAILDQAQIPVIFAH